MLELGAALMGLSAATSLAGMFGGGGVQGSGRMQRIYQQQAATQQQSLAAQMKAGAAAQQYFSAAGDVTSPLFRRTAMMEESRLRRAIAEGIATQRISSSKARARGLTAGVRPERQDEAQYLATGNLFQQASEAAAGNATERLMATGKGLLGIGDLYGGTYRTASAGAQAAASDLVPMQTANAELPWMKVQQGGSFLNTLGQSAGGWGSLFSPRAQPQFYGGTSSGMMLRNPMTGMLGGGV